MRFADWRPGDQRYYVSDTRACALRSTLAPARPWREGLADLAGWLRREIVAAGPQPMAVASVNGASPARCLMTTDAVGGVWTYALDLAEAFAERGVADDAGGARSRQRGAGAAQARARTFA